MSKKIAITDKVMDGKYLERIKQVAGKYGYEAVMAVTEEEKALHIPEAEIIHGYGDKVLKGATECLKWLCASSAGTDWFINSDIRPKHEVLLSNCSGAYGVAVSEHAVMLFLQLLKREPEYNEIIRKRVFKNDLWAGSVYQSKVTILGTGDLGLCLAERLKGFGPKQIVGVNRSGNNPGGAFDKIITQEEVESILPETDALMICLPGTAETKGFVNLERMQLMPSHSVIVNVGRGNVVVQDDIIKALTEGIIKAAALDVYEKEPFDADNPLFDCPNLLMTPHCAGNMVMDYTVERVCEIFCEDLENYFNGRPLKHAVELSVGY